MSLPKYIVNLPELADLLKRKKEEEKQTSSVFNKGKQKSIGMRLKTEGERLRVLDVWYPGREVYVTGIKLGINQNNSWKGNKMDVLINDELRFEDVYFKKESDYKNFRVLEKIEEDGSIEVVLNGKEGAEVWIDIDYIDELSGKVEIEDN